MLNKSHKPAISIVVCTFNRVDLLKGAVQSLIDQTLENSQYEIIVVDNNSTDETRQAILSFADQHPNIHYVKEHKQGLSNARNCGWKKAKAEYVGYIDDDAKADADWLKYAFTVIENIKPVIFGGPYYPFYLTEKPEWLKDEYNSAFFDKSRFLADNEYLSGSNIFIRKSFLDDAGGFDPHIGMSGSEISYGEETALIVKARKTQEKIYYCHEMKVFHLVPDYKMNVFWYLLRSFEHGRKADKMFDLNPKLSTSELTGDLIMNIKLLFDEMKQCISNNSTNKDFLENKIKENISPIASELGQTYERYNSIITRQTEHNLDEIVEHMQITKRYTKRLWKIIITPALLVNYIYKKLIGRD